MAERAHVVVVGGGIAGLAAAHRLVTAGAGADGAGESPRITVLEASDRFGGWVRTEPFAGRPVDFGPDSLLVRTPWAAELCRELGIEDELVAPGSGQALIWARGKLRPLPPGILAGLPNGPMPFVRSGLLGPTGIARAALDLVLPANAPADGADESIGALIRRRLGKQALERVIDPLLGGVHAGRCDELSLAATAPQIAAAARADRSLLRGLRKTAPPAPPEGASRKPVFMAPAAGMQRVVDALVASLKAAGVELMTGVRVESIELRDAVTQSGQKSAGSVEQRSAELRLEGGEVLRPDGVILTVPAPVAAALLEPRAPLAARTLSELRFASVAQVALEYEPATLPELPAATGFLVARGGDLLITACTLLDAKWPLRRELGLAAQTAASDGPGGDRREPPTTRVIKCSVGRIDDQRFESLSDDELVAAIHADLGRTLGLTTPPASSRVFRVSGGLPQYAPGHPARIEAATAEVVTALPMLTLAGAAYTGTSVPMCVRSGRAAADAQLARLTSS